MRKRQWWALGAAASFGLALGLGVFTFGYAKGASYLTNDPAACANCHVMGEHFAAWERGSHRNAATCNDCHTPHDVVGKYTTKALNGFWHSFYFTTGRYPDPLRITEGNRKVTEEACRGCHAEITAAIVPASPGRDRRDPTAGRDAPAATTVPAAGHAADRTASCIRCHQYVGHWVR